jgi:hypothetical protein
MSTILEDYGNETVLNFIQGKIKNNNNVEKDILDKIISPNVDEELIEKVDATIQEIEKLMQIIIYLKNFFLMLRFLIVL